MTEKNPPNRRVKTAETTFGVIEAIRDMDGAGITELADQLDLALSTVHDHVATLENLEYVTKTGREYNLSLKLLDHGTWVKQQYSTISKLSKPLLEDLAAETGQSAWLIVEEHGRGIYLEKAMGEHAVQTSVRVGNREDLHTLAAGKAILAHLPETKIEGIIDRHGLENRTAKTITDRDTLFEDLRIIRERGFALMDEELIEGLRAVGSVITCSDEVRGAVAVAGPLTQMDDEYFEETLPQKVIGVTNEVRLKIKYDQEVNK
jgi:DNA-binding IclR family transcriptional regulator